MNLIKELLDSKLKRRLLGGFFAFPYRSFHQNELRQSLSVPTSALARALKELRGAGLIHFFTKQRQRYYYLNRHFQWYEEIATLLSEDREERTEDLCGKRLRRLKGTKLILLTGVFAASPQLETDVLIVGEGVSLKAIAAAVSDLSRLAGGEINYTVMAPAEFEHRRLMSDRFVRDILDNPHVEIINKLKKGKTLTYV